MYMLQRIATVTSGPSSPLQPPQVSVPVLASQPAPAQRAGAAPPDSRIYSNCFTLKSPFQFGNP